MKLILSILISICFFSFEIQGKTEYTQKDVEIFNSILKQAKKMKYSILPINQIIVNVGKEFLNYPYVAHTLENKGEEHLIVNLREFDCTTFLESVLALSITIKNKQTKFNDYCNNLLQIRYRDKKINRYSSRLHYFSDWIYENQKKDFVKDITKSISNTKYCKTIDFMSKNIKNYKQLQDNPKFIEVIKNTENEINKREMFYVPKHKIPTKASLIKNGDLIAITPKIENLDITHVGIAVEIKGNIFLMHASMTGKKVMISNETIHNYLKSSKYNTGIMVVRAF